MISHDEQGRPICGVCKQPKPNLSLEPNRSQLLFGGFNVQLEYRCATCEKKVKAWVLSQLHSDHITSYPAITS